MTTYQILINRVLGHEAGYVNDPNDPGGETKWGISKRSYPHLNIRDLIRDQAIDIYFIDFWDKMKLDGYKDGIAFQLLDSAVNSGIDQTIRFMQRAIDVADDGKVGPITLSALATISETDLIMLFLAERLEFMTKLKNWPHHGKGWARRIAQNLRYGAEDS